MSCLNFWLSSELRKSKKRLSFSDNDGDNDNVAGALPLPVLSQSLTAAAAAPAQPPTLPDAHAHLPDAQMGSFMATRGRQWAVAEPYQCAVVVNIFFRHIGG